MSPHVCCAASPACHGDFLCILYSPTFLSFVQNIQSRYEQDPHVHRTPPSHLLNITSKILDKFCFKSIVLQLWHLFRSLHRTDTICMSTCEDNIKLFKTSSFGFREEEVHSRYNRCVQHCEDDVCLVAQTCEGLAKSSDQLHSRME